VGEVGFNNVGNHHTLLSTSQLIILSSHFVCSLCPQPIRKNFPVQHLFENGEKVKDMEDIPVAKLRRAAGGGNSANRVDRGDSTNTYSRGFVTILSFCSRFGYYVCRMLVNVDKDSSDG